MEKKILIRELVIDMDWKSNRNMYTEYNDFAIFFGEVATNYIRSNGTSVMAMRFISLHYFSTTLVNLIKLLNMVLGYLIDYRVPWKTESVSFSFENSDVEGSLNINSEAELIMINYMDPDTKETIKKEFPIGKLTKL